MERARRIWGLVAAVGAVVVGTTVASTANWAAAAGPALTVDPATGLTDGATVTITASGLPANEFAYAVQCVAAIHALDDCDTDDVAFGPVDGSGSATLSLRVDAVLNTVSEAAGPQETDCRPAGACIIGLAAGSTVLSAPIAFDPDAPLAPPPTMTVTPDDGLVDFEVVDVEASGLVWSDQAVVRQCAAADQLTELDCDFGAAQWLELEGGDELSVEHPVLAAIETGDQGLVDCRTPGACVLAVSPSWRPLADKTAVVPLGFDPDADVVSPALTVTPDADLVDGQEVTAAGSGFLPGSFVSLLMCAGDPSWSNCEWTDGFGQVDGDGAFETEVEVWAVVQTFAGDVDCRTDAADCALVATSGAPDSVRAGRAPLGFDPDAPLLPPPAITVEPSTNLPAATTVSVAGTGFRANGFATVAVCQAGDLDACDGEGEGFAQPDGDGNFTVDLDVAVTFVDWNGQEVDCSGDPGCEVVATDHVRGRQAKAPLSFASDSPAGRRYFDPVFDDVDVTHDVVYRETVDSEGRPVQLTLDVYEPAGDTADVRPAVVWMPGGWFNGDTGGEGQTDMTAYAETFARRGYVSVVMEYRLRPELHCCPTTDAIGITGALEDGRDDAAAGIEWLREHAADYRIDTDAIAAGGASAGAANAYGLAYPSARTGPGGEHGGHGEMQLMASPSGPSGAAGASASAASIAAALPISGVSLGTPATSAPPVLAFHGREDLTAPQHLSEWTCTDAHEVGDSCEVVSYQGQGGNIATTRRRDIIRRSTEFLAVVMLAPRGYLDEPPPGPTTTTTATTTAPASTTTSPPPTGSLPRTGSNGTLPLFRLGLGLTIAGAGLIHLARLRRRNLRRAVPAPLGDDGRITLVGAALATALLAALTVPNGALAAPAAAGQEGGGLATSSPGTTAGDPTDATDTTDTTDTTVTTVPPDVETTTTVIGDSTTTTVGDTTTTTGVGDGDQLGASGDVPTAGDHGTAGVDPADWTPEQKAYAEGLIDRTEMVLPRFANPAILPLLGYVWILDGTEPDGYQHWINLGRFDDSHILDPEMTESVVFRNGPDGPTLEAAMFILPWSYDLTTIPEDLAWLPGWHTHNNLCFDAQGRLTGLAHDGVCDVGFLVIPPPMMHVWIVDTPCGRFAGIDENGLICDHDHEPMAG